MLTELDDELLGLLDGFLVWNPGLMVEGFGTYLRGCGVVAIDGDNCLMWDLRVRSAASLIRIRFGDAIAEAKDASALCKAVPDFKRFGGRVVMKTGDVPIGHAAGGCFVVDTRALAFDIWPDLSDEVAESLEAKGYLCLGDGGCFHVSGLTIPLRSAALTSDADEGNLHARLTEYAEEGDEMAFGDVLSGFMPHERVTLMKDAGILAHDEGEGFCLTADERVVEMSVRWEPCERLQPYDEILVHQGVVSVVGDLAILGGAGGIRDRDAFEIVRGVFKEEVEDPESGIAVFFDDLGRFTGLGGKVKVVVGEAHEAQDDGENLVAVIDVGRFGCAPFEGVSGGAAARLLELGFVCCDGKRALRRDGSVVPELAAVLPGDLLRPHR